MNSGSNKQPQCWTFPARTKSSALKHRASRDYGVLTACCHCLYKHLKGQVPGTPDGPTLVTSVSLARAQVVEQTADDHATCAARVLVNKIMSCYLQSTMSLYGSDARCAARALDLLPGPRGGADLVILYFLCIIFII